MKKFILLLTLIMLFIFAACSNEIEPQEIPQDSEILEPDEIDEVDVGDEPDVPQEDETESEDLLASWDFSALELVGYYFDEDDRLVIDTEDWIRVGKPEIIREFFLGTWESSKGWFLTIDDMEESRSFWRLSNGFYTVGDNVIVSWHLDSGGPDYYYWINMNEPDILFFQTKWVTTLHNTVDYETAYFTKTDAPLDYPEDGYLTWFREWEITRTYDIDPEMLTDIEFFHEKSGEVLNREGGWRHFNIYLIYETPEKLIFNVPLDDCVGMTPTYTANAIVTLEKTDGEWVRTIEVNEVSRRELIDNEWVWETEEA
ncbi:MAG: hypothetical protein FWD48_07535 [Oscillospiraceae bacterium]|nr:hypothetical protein [Oscillospiraceae bacterium]